MCASENFKISNLKISEAFVIDFEVTFLCDFVLGVLNIFKTQSLIRKPGPVVLQILKFTFLYLLQT